MKRFMASLTGKADPVKLRHGYVHAPATLRRYGLRFVSTDDVQTIKDYRKIVVIRHPLDRFLSAYYDKFTRGKTWIWTSRVDRHLRRRAVNGSRLQRLVTAVVHGLQNLHWSPIGRRCSFPTVDYDDVIRIETFRHDIHVEPVLEYAHADVNNIFNLSEYHHRRNSTRANDSVYHTTVKPKLLNDFSEISFADLVKLKQRFERDLGILGYDFDVNTLVASCSMTDERGETCC